MYPDHETGKRGEEITCDFIQKRGMEIIERNYLCKIGEIDIIAKDKEELVFIEVKTRSQEQFGLPSEAVGDTKKKHIYRVAEYYLMKHQLENVYCRLDVVEVYLYEQNYQINYIKNSILDRPSRKELEEWNEEDEMEWYDKDD